MRRIPILKREGDTKEVDEGEPMLDTLRMAGGDKIAGMVP